MPVSSLAVGKAEVAKLDFTQAEVDGLKAKLLHLTEATIIVRGPGRNAEGGINYIEVPNVGIQLAATVKALEFGVGKPSQMIEVKGGSAIGQTPTGLRDLAQMMAEQPEIANKVIMALKDGLKTSQAIDVSSVKPADQVQPPESLSEGSHSAKP